MPFHEEVYVLYMEKYKPCVNGMKTIVVHIDVILAIKFLCIYPLCGFLRQMTH